MLTSPVVVLITLLIAYFTTCIAALVTMFANAFVRRWTTTAITYNILAVGTLRHVMSVLPTTGTTKIHFCTVVRSYVVSVHNIDFLSHRWTIVSRFS